jgi:hypothetical protein
VCGTIRRPMERKETLQSLLKLYTIKAVPTAIYGSETESRYKDTDSKDGI